MPACCHTPWHVGHGLTLWSCKLNKLFLLLVALAMVSHYGKGKATKKGICAIRWWSLIAVKSFQSGALSVHHRRVLSLLLIENPSSSFSTRRQKLCSLGFTLSWRIGLVMDILNPPNRRVCHSDYFLLKGYTGLVLKEFLNLCSTQEKTGVTKLKNSGISTKSVDTFIQSCVYSYLYPPHHNFLILGKLLFWWILKVDLWYLRNVTTKFHFLILPAGWLLCMTIEILWGLRIVVIHAFNCNILQVVLGGLWIWHQCGDFYRETLPHKNKA